MLPNSWTKRRMALKATVAAIPKLKDQRRELDEQIAAANRILAAAEKKYDATTLET